MAEETEVREESLETKEVVVKKENGMKRTVKEMILYKMDRTIAVVGIIAIGILALSAKTLSPAAITITSAVVTALATYIGGKIKST